MAPGALAQVLREITEREKATPGSSVSHRLVGIETRDDAGVYQLDASTVLVQTVDFFAPLVDDPFVYGQIAAANALSDIYAMNARPLTTLNLVGFPDNELPMEIMVEILAGVADRVALSGAVNLGGHSVRDAEIKVGLAVTGVAAPEEIIRNTGAKAGDLIVLTKPLGTGFVTTANKRGQCEPGVMQNAVESMIQLNVIGRDAARAAGGASALTDVTGYGLAVHASEMVETSEHSVRLFIDQLPVIEGALELIDAGVKNRANGSNRLYLEEHLVWQLPEGHDRRRVELLFDPQTSGGLLIAIGPENVDRLLLELELRGAKAAAVVGQVEPRVEDGWVIVS